MSCVNPAYRTAYGESKWQALTPSGLFQTRPGRRIEAIVVSEARECVRRPMNYYRSRNRCIMHAACGGRYSEAAG